jgi:ABC-type dipeptide/oligopeptide/nickel transport system ATPase component
MIDELPPPDWNCLAVVGKSNSGKSIKLKYIGDINREEYSRAMAEYAKFTDPLNRNGELPWHLSQDVIDAAIESVKIDCSGISKLRNISLKRMICIPRWEPTVGTTETSLYYDHVTIPAK